MIRDLRRSDIHRIFELTKIGFPETEGLLDSSADAVERIARRFFRWDTQFVVRLFRLFGRPIYRYLVVEEDRTVVAATLLTFPERAGYVSNVVVDPEYRRRGYAQALLERAREIAASVGRRYMVLQVHRSNAPALTLYERIGYRPLGVGGAIVARDAAPAGAGSPSSAVRPFVSRDARPLVEVVRRTTSPEVLEVLPPGEGAIRGSAFVDRALESHTRAWVLDRGNGPEAHVAATVGGASAAAHLSEPFVGDGVSDGEVAALVRCAIDWCNAGQPRRILGHVGFSNARGRAALAGSGFREIIEDVTLYRPVH